MNMKERMRAKHQAKAEADNLRQAAYRRPVKHFKVRPKESPMDDEDRAR